MALRSTGGASIRVLHLEYADVDPDTPGDQPGVLPGVAASDSDGSECDDTDAGTPSAQAVIDVGGGGQIVADGPSCPGQLSSSTTIVGSETFIVGVGCGITAALAPDVNNGWPRWASPANGIVPTPVGLPARLTREPVDHRFNCDVTYDTLPDPNAFEQDVAWASNPLLPDAPNVPRPQDIGDCPDAGSDSPHIYDLIDGVTEDGLPTIGDPWNEISGDECDVDGTVLFSGNQLVNCRNFQVQNGDLAIFTGNVVFNGALTLTGTGELAVNADEAAWLGSQTLVGNADPAFMFFRGTANGKGNRTVVMNGEEGGAFLFETTVYLSKNVTSFSFNGGSSTRWLAPSTGDFRGLALWSDTDATHSFAGQAGSTLSGTFFTPWADVTYSGGSNGTVVSAQFVAWSLTASGQGELLLQPSPEQAVAFNLAPTSALIR
jgi:hypothetical protein